MRYAIYQQGTPTPDGRAVINKVGELNAPNTDAAIAAARTMPLFLMARRGGKDLGGFPVVEPIR